MSFGQLVIGPPGAGKTTYCNAMHDFLIAQGRSVTLRIPPPSFALASAFACASVAAFPHPSPLCWCVSLCVVICLFFLRSDSPAVVVNLDPGNDALPYPAGADVKDLISMEDVMDSFQLGPNGGLIYCVEYLEKNIKWLTTKIKDIQKKEPSQLYHRAPPCAASRWLA
jgi:GTPase SAR1 family protein